MAALALPADLCSTKTVAIIPQACELAAARRESTYLGKKEEEEKSGFVCAATGQLGEVMCCENHASNIGQQPGDTASLSAQNQVLGHNIPCIPWHTAEQHRILAHEVVSANKTPPRLLSYPLRHQCRRQSPARPRRRPSKSTPRSRGRPIRWGTSGHSRQAQRVSFRPRPWQR